jgi:chromosome condensin MukBEF ATPase and DNA-binding subunit MukB
LTAAVRLNGRKFVAWPIALAFAFAILAPFNSGASERDEALRKTQELLRDKTKRTEALEQDSKAKSLNEGVEKRLGSQTEQAYELAAQILPVIVERTGGDPAKMQALMESYQKNPKSFFDQLTPEQRKRIKDMAERLPPPSGGAQSKP